MSLAAPGHSLRLSFIYNTTRILFYSIIPRIIFSVVFSLFQASEELEAANSQLESEIAYLTAEREQLEMMLDAHVCNMEKVTGRGPA